MRIFIKEDENGNPYIEIPEELAKQVGWADEQLVEVSVVGETIILKKM